MDVASNLKVGSVLRVRKVGIWHEGVYAGACQVIHASSAKGQVVLDSLEEFLGGQALRVKGYPGKLLSADVVARAYSKLGTPYKAFSDNCEHLTNFAHGVGKKSPQLRFWGGLAALSLVYFLRKNR